MIGRRKKQAPIQRAPHLGQQKQTTFRYSSNRSETERLLARQDVNDAEKAVLSKERIMRRLKRTPYVLSGCIIVVAAVYFSLLPAAPKIVIQGDQAPLREGTPYTEVVSTLTNNPESHSKLSINRQKISNQLTARFPELHEVAVTTPLFGKRAVIELMIAQPVVVFNSGADTYLIDSNGTALLNIARDRALIKTDALPVVIDQSNTRVELGKQVLTSSQVAFIVELGHQSQAKNLAITTINLGAGAGELAVRYTDVPYFVKYNLNEDARKSFGTFFATKEYIESTNVKPAEYIDVRIPERAYVK